MQLYCVGTSHLGAIRDAARDTGAPVKAAHVHRVSEGEDGRIKFLRTFIDELPTKGPIFSVIGGNSHNVIGLVRHRLPFDFIHPAHKDLPIDEEARLLPYEVVKTALWRKCEHWLQALENLATQLPGRVVQFESPAPIEDQDYLAAETILRLQVRGLEGHEIAAPALRFKLWRVHSEIVENWCRKVGVKFDPVPRQSLTEGGFLRREYWGNPTHANGAYGALLIDRMNELAYAPV